MQSLHKQISKNPGVPSGANPDRFPKAVLVALLLATLTLCACSGHVRRSAGTVLDDQTLEVSVLNAIYSHPNFSDKDHIKVEVNDGVVLLAGETVSAENSAIATRLAEENRLTRRVVNDLKVQKHAGLGAMLDNTWLSTKVKSVLVKENAIPGFDATRIKVTSSQNTVYLMGLVTRKEGDAVAEVVRNIGGVERVVKIFDYTDD